MSTKKDYDLLCKQQTSIDLLCKQLGGAFVFLCKQLGRRVARGNDVVTSLR